MGVLAMEEQKVTEVNVAVDDDKKAWTSWTLWASLITVIAPAFPPVQVFLVAHPEVLSAVGVIFGVLRLKTSKAIQKKKAH